MGWEIVTRKDNYTLWRDPRLGMGYAVTNDRDGMVVKPDEATHNSLCEAAREMGIEIDPKLAMAENEALAEYKILLKVVNDLVDAARNAYEKWANAVEDSLQAIAQTADKQPHSS